MKSSKIERLLKALRNHELQLLEKFISSPYFNSKKDLIRMFYFLYANIKKDKLDFNLGTREEAFHFVYPGAPFDNIKMTKLLSELVNLVQQFYVNQEIRYNNSLSKKVYISSLKERNLDNQFVQESKKLITQLEASPIKDANLHFDLHLLKKGLHFQQGKLTSSKDLTNLIEVQKQLDTYYLLSKLQITCEVACLQNTFEEFNDLLLSDTIDIEELSSKYSSESILIPLYIQNLHNIQNINNPKNFDKLISMFFNNLSSIAPNEQLALFVLILNTNGMKINSGHPDSIGKQFELYQRGLENKILIKNNRMTPESFTNIVVLASHLNKTKWAESFIKNNSKYLPENIREACILFSKGKIAFRQEKFEETLKFLWNCRFDQLAFDLRTKSFTIRTLFEIFYNNQSSDQYDFCVGQIQTIEKFIRRRKGLNKNKANAYLNFIKITKRLLKLVWDNKLTFSQANRLKTKIHSYDNIIAKSWLLQKVDTK